MYLSPYMKVKQSDTYSVLPEGLERENYI